MINGTRCVDQRKNCWNTNLGSWINRVPEPFLGWMGWGMDGGACFAEEKWLYFLIIFFGNDEM